MINKYVDFMNQLNCFCLKDNYEDYYYDEIKICRSLSNLLKNFNNINKLKIIDNTYNAIDDRLLLFSFIYFDLNSPEIYSSLKLKIFENFILENNLKIKLDYILDIALKNKIQNIEIFKIVNILLQSTFLNNMKFYEDSFKLLSSGNIENLLINPYNIFEQFFIQKFNIEQNIFIKYLRHKILVNYLNVYQHLKIPITNIFKLYRGACLNNDNMIMNILINNITHQFIQNKFYSQAYNFLIKTNFNNKISDKQSIRFYYNLAKINLIKREFYKSLININKCLNLVEKNKNEIEKTNFYLQLKRIEIIINLYNNCDNNLEYKNINLNPYLIIQKIVTLGKVNYFAKFFKYYSKIFQKDNLYLTILNLRRICINNGLTRINKKYENKIIQSSKIKEILFWNDLDEFYTSEEFIYIIMKSIKDGIINAKINYKNKSKYEVEFKDYLEKEVEINFKNNISHNDYENLCRSISNSTNNSIDI